MADPSLSEYAVFAADVLAWAIYAVVGLLSVAGFLAIAFLVAWAVLLALASVAAGLVSGIGVAFDRGIRAGLLETANMVAESIAYAVGLTLTASSAIVLGLLAILVPVNLATDVYAATVTGSGYAETVGPHTEVMTAKTVLLVAVLSVALACGYALLYARQQTYGGDLWFVGVAE